MLPRLFWPLEVTVVAARLIEATLATLCILIPLVALAHGAKVKLPVPTGPLENQIVESPACVKPL